MSENLKIDKQNLLYRSTEVNLNSSNEDINSSAVKLEVSENLEIDQQNFLLRYANGERDFHGLKLTGVNNGLKLDGVNISGINLSRAIGLIINMRYHITDLSGVKNIKSQNVMQSN